MTRSLSELASRGPDKASALDLAPASPADVVAAGGRAGLRCPRCRRGSMFPARASNPAPLPGEMTCLTCSYTAYATGTVLSADAAQVAVRHDQHRRVPMHGKLRL